MKIAKTQVDQNISYSEIPQSNPIRFTLLYREGDTLHPQTKQFKCRDFFNDFVSAIHGNQVNIYGMNTATMKFNEEGLYIKLNNIIDFEKFTANLNNLITKENPDHPVELIQLHGKTVAVIFIPKFYTDSTYLISYVTLLIRISNNDYVYDSIEHMQSKNPDQATCYSSKPKPYTRYKFNLPEHARGYWYYAGNSYNSKDCPTPYTPSIIHNNGFVNWISYI